MAKRFYSIYHTRAFTSNILERIFFGWISLLVWFGLVFLITGMGLVTQRFATAGILLGATIFVYVVAYLYISKKLRKPTEPPILENNYAAHFSYDVATHLVDYFPRKLSYPQLFEAAVLSPRGEFIVRKMGLEPDTTIKKVRDYFESFENTPDIEVLLDACMETYVQLEEPKIDANTVLWVFFQQGGVFTQILNQANLAQEDFIKIIEWEALRYYNTPKTSSLDASHIRKNFGALGRSWTIGYTNDLDAIADDITARVEYRDPHQVVIHQGVLRTVLESLSKSSRNNVLLLGSVGVGKSTIVDNLAYHIRRFQIEHNKNLSRVMRLHVTDLLSGVEDAPGYLLNALNYAERSGNIILVIENISNLFSSADDEIRNIITKFLNSTRVNVIGLDNPEGYHMGIKSYPAIDSLFERLIVPDASEEETMNVLMMNSFTLEKYSKISVTYQSLKAVMSFARRYVTKGGFPGKAVEILSDAVDKCRAEGNQFVLESHIRSVVSTRTNINLNQMEEGEKAALISLESKLHDEIKGQDEALVSISNALKRAKLDVGSTDKPIGTFLFLGPTGVGKTETAKALAKHYFGSKERMIRLDMNEFADAESVYGILGSPSGQSGYQEGFLTKQVQDRPFSLILLDEIEKAHKNVLNIFLQILDEGFLIDNRGVRTDFRNTIIIATSNAGALFLRDYVRSHPGEFDKEEFKGQLIDEIINGGQFAPEFVNRFTEVIVYYPLRPEHVYGIAQKMIGGMSERFEQERGVTLDVSDEAIQYIAEQGYSMDFGARELERTITDILETYLADYLLLHNVSRGDAIHIDRADIEK